MNARVLAVLTALALLVAACGDDDAADTTMAMDGHDHMHGAVEVEGDPPSISIEVLPDPKMGWNVFAAVDGMAFAPEAAAAGAPHAPGEGHGHLYVDGEKVARVYGTDFHLTGLAPGTHEIRYTLNANDHRTYAVDGVEVAATATIEVPEAAGGMGDGHAHGHGDMAMVPVDGPIPTVSLTVTPDPKMGWNVHMPTTDFTWLPRLAGAADPVWGEGHGHLYVDGQKVARVYGEWFHLESLEPGTREIRITLNHHDHGDYLVDGAVIEAVATVEVSGEAAAARVIDVEATDGRAARVAVDSGERVTLRVTAAEGGTLHLHGYEVYAVAAAGTPSDLTFTASIPGVFELEIEETGTLVAEVTVE